MLGHLTIPPALDGNICLDVRAAAGVVCVGSGYTIRAFPKYQVFHLAAVALAELLDLVFRKRDAKLCRFVEHCLRRLLRTIGRYRPPEETVRTVSVYLLL